MQFATADLEDAPEQGAVNGIGNARRAVHPTVGALVQAYGLLARNQRSSFPQKLELIDEAGLLSLAILSTLDLERGAVEHEYRVPARARVQEVIDVARLWLLATWRLRGYVACGSLAGWRADVAPGVVQLDPARGLLSFFKVTGPGKEHEHEAKQYAFPEPIPMTGGALTPGAGIDPGPLWTAALRCQNRDERGPVPRPAAALNAARYGVDAAAARRRGLEAPVRVTLPLAGQERVREFLESGTMGSAVLNYAGLESGSAPSPAGGSSPGR